MIPLNSIASLPLRLATTQATIQDWFRIVATCVVTTAVPMPRLIPSMREEAARRAAEEGGAKEGAVLARFVAALERMADDITATNTGRRAQLPFGSFSPAVLELSCSL